MTGARSRPCGTRARAGPARKARQDAFCRLKGRLRELVWVGGCVTAPVAWASGPSAPPGRASGRGYAGVYTDWRKWPLGATTARMRSAPFGHVAVASLVQNALFRRVRFSSPAQTWSHLTQRRILRRRSHVKAQSAPATSRKGALCATARMQNALFGEAHTQNALFRESDTPRMRLSVSCRLQSGAFVCTVATRFAETSTHTNPRRALKGQHWSIRER